MVAYSGLCIASAMNTIAEEMEDFVALPIFNSTNVYNCFSAHFAQVKPIRSTYRAPGMFWKVVWCSLLSEAC